MSNGWDESAQAWIEAMGDRGDYSREFVLDMPMMKRVRRGAFRDALDVGCGEGRFCRMMCAAGTRAVGIDPTAVLIARARQRHHDGDYRIASAESLPFPDTTFDLVVSYLTLIDIGDARAAMSEMARVLRPGGSLLIANLTSFFTAAVGGGWTRDSAGEPVFKIDQYLTERAEWAHWRGIGIRNWHRPLDFYVSHLLAERLNLRYFSEPAPSGGDAAKAERYRRVPFFLIMEWSKSGSLRAETAE